MSNLDSANDGDSGVSMDADTCKQQLKALSLAKFLAIGEADVRAGRVRSARLVFLEFKKFHKISSQLREE